MINGHGGNIYECARKLNCSPDEIIDMSSNINPLGSPPLFLDDMKSHIDKIHQLPEVNSKTLIRTFAVYYDKHIDQIACAAGTTEFIYQLPLILNSKKVLILGPTYADFADACKRTGVDFKYLISEAANDFQPLLKDKDMQYVDTVYICNPNNPTGYFMPFSQIKSLCKSYPDVRFIVDESYLHFSQDYEYETMIRSGLTNVIILCSFSKIFAIPGLRLGFMVAHKDIITAFRKQEKPWNVNTMAQIAGSYIFENNLEIQNFIQKTALYIQTEKKRFQQSLAQHPHVESFGSFAPFILIKLPDQFMAENISSKLLQKKVLIRDCSNFYGLSSNYIRIAYKDEENNKQILEYLNELLR